MFWASEYCPPPFRVHSKARVGWMGAFWPTAQLHRPRGGGGLSHFPLLPSGPCPRKPPGTPARPRTLHTTCGHRRECL